MAPVEQRENKQRENNRSAALLDTAARLFADQGYHRTTIRDITAEVGMGPGSSYYHFSSKADMLLAVYGEGVRRVTASVRAALEGHDDDPWARLEAGLAAHIGAIVAPTAYARVMVAVLPDDVPDIADDLRRARDGYEILWRQLIDDLDAHVDVGLLRLFLLGAANSTPIWYRSGRHTPDEIAASFVRFLHRPMGEQ